MTLDLETQLARYGDALDRAAVPTHARRGEVPIVDVKSRRPRVVALVAAAIVVAVVVASFAIVRASTSDDRGAPVQPATRPDATTSTTTVLHGGVQVTVPAGWRVLRGNQCPGADKTILLGAGKKSGCAKPRASAPWAWLAPAAAQRPSDLESCAVFQVNQVQGCTAETTSRTVTFVGGTDVALVTGPLHASTTIAAAPFEIRSSLAYADPTIDRSAAQEPQPLPIATAVAGAYALGDCELLHTEMLQTIPGVERIPCPQPASFIEPDGTLPLPVESQLGATNRETNVVTAKVTYGGTHAYLVRMRHGWFLANRRSQWSIVDVKATDASTPLPTTPLPVASKYAVVEGRSGHVAGYVRVADTVAMSRLVALEAQYGGIPVYATKKAAREGGAVVGVVPNNLPFVPQRLVPRIPELRACTTAAKAHRFDATQPPISDDCRSLLHEWGMTDTAIDVTG